MMFIKRIDLSNKFFEFRYGLEQNEEGEDPGINEEWYKHGISQEENEREKPLQKVYVPSTWSYYQNRSKFNYFGTGWYQTKIFLPEQWGIGDGKKVLMVFNGVNYKTTLWINGKKIGFHEGGFTKFWFDIGDQVKYGKDNLVVIQVDNRYGENRLPWGTPNIDLMNYGGIYRTLYLKVINPVNIDDYSISNSIVFNQEFGEGYENPHAKLRVNIKIKDNRPHNRKFKGNFIFTVKNEDFQTSKEVVVDLTNSKEDLVSAEVEIPNAHLWSPDNPYLYNLTFQLLDSNRRELDRESIKWGIREFVVKNKKFYLNNQSIILRGINHIEDHPDVGSSLNPRLIYNDLNIMKEANINCIRTLYHPPYKSLIEMADELGFLIIEDLPIWGLKEKDYTQRYLSNASQQLWEMIHRDKSHCSVVGWVIGNNCEISDGKSFDFFKNLILLSKELDPTRMHSISLNNLNCASIHDLLDFIVIRTEMGWEDDLNFKLSQINDYLNDIQNKISKEDKLNKKPFIIGEIGAGSISGFKDFSEGHWSEHYQYNLLETFIKNIITRDSICGLFVSCFQDYRTSTFRGYLDRPKAFNNMGIVDMHRDPKDAYYAIRLYYDLWSKKTD